VLKKLAWRCSNARREAKNSLEETMIFRALPANNRQPAAKNAHADQDSLYLPNSDSYRRNRCPKGTSNNRKAALLNLIAFGGPLNCIHITARSG
jgi:hypothetical protein